VPILPVGTAVDASCRIAESLKVKKSELAIGAVRSRVEREIERHLKAFRSVAV
jgi:hypothetical protein